MLPTVNRPQLATARKSREHHSSAVHAPHVGAARKLDTIESLLVPLPRSGEMTSATTPSNSGGSPSP